MNLESAIREFKMLASKERLSPSELARAKELMVELKRLGMTNLEIAELSQGRWSESAVKGYTRGVQTTDPEPWKSTAALFSEMASRNLTLAEVSQAMATTTELEATGSSLADVVSFMQELKERETTLSQLSEAININARLERMGTSPSEIAGFIQGLEQEKVDVPSFVLLLHDWHEAGLTATDARSALSYRAQLEEAGFDIEALPHIAEAAGKLGNPPEVLEAVAEYGNLGELDQELKTKREELDTLATEMQSRNQELDAASQKLEEVRSETATIVEALATYRRLETIGFDERALDELAKAAEKYGTPRKVLRAINKFVDLTKIKTTDDELRNKVKKKRAMAKSLDEQYSHLKEPIEMCKRLLKRKFGLRALYLINRTAWRYGEPTEVMKAIEAYGALKEIKKETDQAKTVLAEIKGKVEVENETYAEYNARNKAMLDQLEALEAKAIEVGRIVGGVQEQLKGDTMARDLLLLLRNPSSASYEDSLPLVIVLLRGITIWALMNKSKFSYPSLIDKNLQAVLGSLGGS
ncbi:hypothetical protein ES703_42059 [subsurface metagenome]